MNHAAAPRSGDSPDFEEIHRLATASLEGTLAPAQIERLEQLVCQNPEARRLLARYLLASSSLRSWAASRPAALAMETPPPSAAVVIENLRAPAWSRLSSPIQFLGLVAFSTTALWLIFFTIFFGGPSSQQIAELRGVEPPTIARLTGAYQCVWADQTQAPLVGMKFTPGERLHLRQGLAEITFADGARVVLKGPALCALKSPSRAMLHEGRLTARVESGAEGFAVDTPDLQVVDWGTEFGVAVRPAAPSQVVVFEGRVEVTPRDMPAQKVVTYAVDSGQSFRFHSGAWSNAPLATAERRQFTRRLPPRPDRALPDEIVPVVDRLQLWLAADAGVGQDAEGRVVVWGDLATAQRDPHHARQDTPDQRPLWVADGAKGRPAIRFHGGQFLTTAPMNLGNQVTVFAVYALHPRSGEAPQLGGQIFNTNGPPNLNLKIHPGGAASSWLTLGGDHRGQQLVRTGPAPPNRWHTCALVYNRQAGVVTLWQDGRLMSQAPVTWDLGGESPKLIGSNFRQKELFRGDLGELLVYDRALRPHELHTLQKYAVGKFNHPQ